MNKAKMLSLLSNLLIIANLVVGFLQLHWAIIALFVILHAGCRMAFLQADSAPVDDNATQTTIAPPMIRNVASIITAVILAVVVYWLGYGLRMLTGA